MRHMDIEGIKRFEFTRGWFRARNLAAFREHVHPAWAGKPVVYLELGVFEGMSMVWMLQRVLTHPDSRAVGIDPWLMTEKLDAACMEQVRRRAEQNLLNWTAMTTCSTGHNAGNASAEGSCRLQQANSAEALRKMFRRGGFLGLGIGRGLRRPDLSLIDGGHNALAVLDDARLVFRLLQPGGQMIFDDVENDIDKGPDHVKGGLAMFLADMPPVKLVWKSRYCECWEKLDDA